LAKQKQSSVVVVGALAYDQISHTQGHFRGTPEPLLNCKLEDLVETFGGCGGNIAYNLANLGTQVQLVSATGTEDDQNYVAHLASFGIQVQCCIRQQHSYTARAVIITDPAGHQFTGFFPGPVISEAAWQQHLSQLDFDNCAIFVQAPYPPALMLATLKHASTLKNTPLRICCPGQYADQLTATEATDLLTATDWLIGNAYEIAHLAPFTEDQALVIIETNGAEGITVQWPQPTERGTHKDAVTRSPDVFQVPKVKTPIDPTGCGDAFLSGLAHTLANGPTNTFIEHLPSAIQQGIHTAALCLTHKGAQRHFDNH